MSYKLVKKIVLIFLLSLLSFGFGYLYFGSKLSSWISKPQQDAGGPPAPVMQALKTLHDRIAANPKDEDAYTELAGFYFQAGKYEQALMYYQKAVSIRPDDIAARNDLALCYHLLKQSDKAIETLREAIKMSPGSQHLWLTLGLVYSETGKSAEARKALESAYHINPKSDAGIEAKSMLQK